MPEKKRLQDAYKTILGDNFPRHMKITFDGGIPINAHTLVYEKCGWEIDGENKGLRYGENPGQQAALYKLINGNLLLGDVTTIQPGQYLASDVDLVQSGKHPGKTNITDTDNALNILRYFTDVPAVAIMKHNNPCGVAIASEGDSLVDVYDKANMADRVAAFGGTIALNRAVDKVTAETIIQNYSEVVVAPSFEPGVMDIFEEKEKLRVMQIGNIEKLQNWAGEVVLEYKALIDGGLVIQTSYVPKAMTLDDIKALPRGYHNTKTKGDFKIARTPTEQEYRDMWFGWLVESGITSNSVIYVKDGVTVGIGTGEQDRVGVAKIARDKAYEKLRDRLCFSETGRSYDEAMHILINHGTDANFFGLLDAKSKADDVANDTHGGLEGAVAVSDAFFPKRDGIDVVLNEGVKAIIQPGGSISDYEVIQSCNEAGATMVFTGQRSFKH